MTYLRNCWYVAGWSEDVPADAPFSRRLLDQPILLFRDETGAVVALDDMCPHRFAPLSLGRIVEGRVQCGYHGLRFDGAGYCTHSPQPGWKLPASPMVRAYPVIERYGIVWIWMGDADLADAEAIPPMPAMEAPGYTYIRGTSHTPGNYILSIENLLDLSHPEFLHDDSLGSPAHRDAHYEVIAESEREVHSNRWFASGPIPPAFEHNFPTGGKPVEHWVNMRWLAPSNLWLWTGATFPGDDRQAGLNSYTAHLLTPETDRMTHYFWCLSLPFPDLPQARIDAIRARLSHVFNNEDAPMTAAVQARMGDREFWSMRPAILPGDKAGVMVRRNLARLIAREQESVETADR